MDDTQTNHIEQLDGALIRPGRIDVQLEYKLTSRGQAAAMFKRFYNSDLARLATQSKPETSSSSTEKAPIKVSSAIRDFNDLIASDPDGWPARLDALAEQFTAAIPPASFSTADIQGYLLVRKMRPLKAVEDVEEWAKAELEKRRIKKENEEKRKERIREARAKARAMTYGGGWGGPPQTGQDGQTPAADGTDPAKETEAQAPTDTTEVAPTSEQPNATATTNGHDQPALVVEEELPIEGGSGSADARSNVNGTTSTPEINGQAINGTRSPSPLFSPPLEDVVASKIPLVKINGISSDKHLETTVVA